MKVKELEQIKKQKANENLDFLYREHQALVKNKLDAENIKA